MCLCSYFERNLVMLIGAKNRLFGTEGVEGIINNTVVPVHFTISLAIWGLIK